MKKVIFILFFGMSMMLSSAQNPDEIITTEGETISCTITKIDKKELFYRIENQNGDISNYNLAISRISSIKTNNDLIAKEFNKVKTELETPASEDLKKAFLLIGGGGGLTLLGITFMALSNSSGIREHKRGQFLATGQALTITGLGLAGYGVYRLLKIKEKI